MPELIKKSIDRLSTFPEVPERDFECVAREGDDLKLQLPEVEVEPVRDSEQVIKLHRQLNFKIELLEHEDKAAAQRISELDRFSLRNVDAATEQFKVEIKYRKDISETLASFKEKFEKSQTLLSEAQISFARGENNRAQYELAQAGHLAEECLENSRKYFEGPNNIFSKYCGSKKTSGISLVNQLDANAISGTETAENVIANARNISLMAGAAAATTALSTGAWPIGLGVGALTSTGISVGSAFSALGISTVGISMVSAISRVAEAGLNFILGNLSAKEAMSHAKGEVIQDSKLVAITSLFSIPSFRAANYVGKVTKSLFLGGGTFSGLLVGSTGAEHIVEDALSSGGREREAKGEQGKIALGAKLRNLGIDSAVAFLTGGIGAWIGFLRSFPISSAARTTTTTLETVSALMLGESAQKIKATLDGRNGIEPGEHVNQLVNAGFGTFLGRVFSREFARASEAIDESSPGKPVTEEPLRDMPEAKEPPEQDITPGRSVESDVEAPEPRVRLREEEISTAVSQLSGERRRLLGELRHGEGELATELTRLLHEDEIVGFRMGRKGSPVGRLIYEIKDAYSTSQDILLIIGRLAAERGQFDIVHECAELVSEYAKEINRGDYEISARRLNSYKRADVSEETFRRENVFESRLLESMPLERALPFYLERANYWLREKGIEVPENIMAREFVPRTREQLSQLTEDEALVAIAAAICDEFLNHAQVKSQSEKASKLGDVLAEKRVELAIAPQQTYREALMRYLEGLVQPEIQLRSICDSVKSISRDMRINTRIVQGSRRAELFYEELGKTVNRLLGRAEEIADQSRSGEFDGMIYDATKVYAKEHPAPFSNRILSMVHDDSARALRYSVDAKTRRLRPWAQAAIIKGLGEDLFSFELRMSEGISQRLIRQRRFPVLEPLMKNIDDIPEPVREEIVSILKAGTRTMSGSYSAGLKNTVRELVEEYEGVRGKGPQK